MDNWVVYILECSDGSLYTGATNNVLKRLQKHNSGKGAKYTKYRRPVKLLKTFKAENKIQALKLEYRVKKMSRKNKLDTIINCNSIEDLIMKLDKKHDRSDKVKKAALNFKNKLEKILQQALLGKTVKSDKTLLVNDVADLIKYCNLLIRGDLRKASIMQEEGLDTDVRDMIPASLYNLVSSALIISSSEEK